jgi:hypothetical protein
LSPPPPTKCNDERDHQQQTIVPTHAKKKLCLSQGDWIACSNHHGGICCFKSVVLGTFAVLSTIAAVGLVRSAAVAKVATIAILAPSPVALGICGVLVPAPCSDLDGGSQLDAVVLGAFAVLSAIATVGLVRSAAVLKVATVAILAPSPVASGICGVLVPASSSNFHSS